MRHMTSSPKTSGKLGEIAAGIGCSPSTVSRVLNGCRKGFSVSRELEAKILAAAEALEYRPNPFLRVMRSKESKIFAIFDPTTNVSGVLHNAKSAFIGAIRKNGYLETGKYVSLYRQDSYTLPFPVAAALLFDISDVSFLSFLEKKEIPYVVINGLCRSGGVSVQLDEEENMRLAVDYLYGLGHRRILLYGGHYDAGSRHQHYSAKIREMEYRENLLRLGLPVPEDELLRISDPGEFLVRAAKPFGATAVICYDHVRVLALLREMAKNGLRVPDDLNLFSMTDEFPLAELPVPVSAITAPAAKMGEIAAELLIRMIKEDVPQNERNIQLTGHLAKRNSTSKQKEQKR